MIFPGETSRGMSRTKVIPKPLLNKVTHLWIQLWTHLWSRTSNHVPASSLQALLLRYSRACVYTPARATHLLRGLKPLEHETLCSG